MDTIILSSDDVKRVLEVFGRDEVMRLVIDRLYKSFAALGNDTVINSPARSGFSKSSNTPGVIELMPHYAVGEGVTVKTITYSPQNYNLFGLPTVLGYVCRVDDATGMPSFIADGVVLTAIRTGAASAVASDLLAVSECRNIGIIGAGAQAVGQLHGLSLVREFDQVLVYDISYERAASLVERADFLDCKFTLSNPEEIMKESDIVCVATSVGVGAGPVLPDAEYQSHLHINAVGADEVGKTELPKSLLHRSFVCADHLAQARREGECQQLDEDRSIELLSSLCARRERAIGLRDQLTVFDSTGFALEDHVALNIFIELSQSIGLGEKYPIVRLPADTFNPYS